MNQIHKLVAVISIVTFLQGCAFFSLMDALYGLNAAGKLMAKSANNASSESVENSESLTGPSESSDEAENQVAKTCDVSGTYISEITSSSKWQLTKKYQKLKITLTQDEIQIRGSDDKFRTKIEAKILGDVIIFYVIPGKATGFYGIDGEWRIGSDSTGLTGSWISKGSPDAAAGTWNLIKIE